METLKTQVHNAESCKIATMHPSVPWSISGIIAVPINLVMWLNWLVKRLMVLVALLGEYAGYWSPLYNFCSQFDQWLKWKILLCVNLRIRKQKKRKCSITLSRATCLPRLPRQQQRGQSNVVLESSNAEGVNEATGRCGGAAGDAGEQCVCVWTLWNKGTAAAVSKTRSDAVFPFLACLCSQKHHWPPESHLLFQRSGWRQSESWEEGRRSVWVCLCNEHSNWVLLQQPGERCVSVPPSFNSLIDSCRTKQ